MTPIPIQLERALERARERRDGKNQAYRGAFVIPSGGGAIATMAPPFNRFDNDEGHRKSMQEELKQELKKTQEEK